MTTLTLKEQEQSISKGKKKLNKAPSKIVLCSPFGKYWPSLSAEDSDSVAKLLSSTLIREKPKTKIPWRKLSKSPKSIRIQQTQEYLQQFPPSEELLQQRKIIKFGLNTVSRAIQNSRISSCILAGDVEPDVILKPIISLAVIGNKPVIILPNMRQLTNKIIGFPCSALGIELPDEKHSQYKLLNDVIVDCWKKIPLPPNAENRSKKIDDNVNQDEILYNIADKTKETVEPNDVYLYRESTNVRAFQPPAIDSKTTEKLISTALDFMSLDVSKDQRTYIPANLKRSLKTDKNRKKRKINE
ncbi:uncharacterized protein LOC135840717 [Planococcus citri]|uniref:uncharacterized protein LOC135840717 n=1 Tax=Planococcus citri TaxID=170843 RepID=UPI0031FA0550